MAAQPPQERDRPAKGARRSTKELVRTGAVVVLAIYFTLFAVLNLKDVQVD